MLPSKVHTPTASLIWLDPGESTGVALLALDPGWLMGNGAADWSGLRRAVKSSYLAQVGFDARWWNGDKALKIEHDDDEIEPRVQVPDSLLNGPAITDSLANELEQIFEIRELLDQWPAACWGYEDYVPESMAAAQKDPLTTMRIFSTLTFYAIMDDTNPRAPFVQNRSMKYTANDARMREAGLYLPGMPHATDAARHAAVFARQARQKSEIRAAAWPRLFGENGRYAA